MNELVLHIFPLNNDGKSFERNSRIESITNMKKQTKSDKKKMLTFDVLMNQKNVFPSFFSIIELHGMLCLLCPLYFNIHPIMCAVVAASETIKKNNKKKITTRPCIRSAHNMAAKTAVDQYITMKRASRGIERKKEANRQVYKWQRRCSKRASLKTSMGKNPNADDCSG